MRTYFLDININTDQLQLFCVVFEGSMQYFVYSVWDKLKRKHHTLKIKGPLNGLGPFVFKRTKISVGRILESHLQVEKNWWVRMCVFRNIFSLRVRTD